MGKSSQLQQSANQTIEAKKAKNKHQEAALDEALKESFPASDPVAVSFPPAVIDEAAEPDHISAAPCRDIKNHTARKKR